MSSFQYLFISFGLRDIILEGKSMTEACLSLLFYVRSLEPQSGEITYVIIKRKPLHN